MSLVEAAYGVSNTPTRSCEGINCPNAPIGRVFVRAGRSIVVCEVHRRILDEAGEVVDFVAVRIAVGAVFEQDTPRPLRFLHAGGRPGARPRPAPPRLAPSPPAASFPPRARAGALAPSATAPPPLRVVQAPSPPPPAPAVTPPAPASPIEAPMSVQPPFKPARRLCATPGCSNPKDARGLCGTCRVRAKRLGIWTDRFPEGEADLVRLQELWKERLRTNPSARAASERVARIGTPNNLGTRTSPTCRWPGCERLGDHSGWCDRDSKRIVSCGLEPDVEPATAAAAWERRSKLREAASAAGMTLEAYTRMYEVAREITTEVEQVLPNRKEVPPPLGLPPKAKATRGDVAERRPCPCGATNPVHPSAVHDEGCAYASALADLARTQADLAMERVEGERHRRDAHDALTAAGVANEGTPAERIRLLAGERDRYRAEVVNAHAALDAMPSTIAADCETPEARIRYATAAWKAEREEASRLADLCEDAHKALDAAGAPRHGTPAERIVSAQEVDAYRARGVPAPPPRGAFRIVNARLDDVGRVVLRLEQDDGREPPEPIPVGALVALQVAAERVRG